MKIWYDVTDLVGWKLPHLTGIQRTTVGILNGLVAQAAPVGLVRYNAKSGGFCITTESELPATVRCHLDGCSTESGGAVANPGPAPAATTPAAVRRKLKLLKRHFLLGSTGEAEDLRQAFRQFKTAARQLRKSVGHWAKRRMRRGFRPERPICPPPHMRGATVSAEDAGRHEATFIAPGDVLMSIGATWVMPGHSEAIAGIRSRGVKVVRMIYDLIPTIKPQWLEPSHTKAITAWVRGVLRESDRVLTISEFSRQEIERYCAESRFEVPPLTVVRLGDVMANASAKAAEPPLPRFSPTRPFFVCVSTLDVRKNHRLLYDAWTQLAGRLGEKCPDLVCIGTPHLYVADLLREICQDRSVNRHIHVVHGVEDCELDWYYKKCQATIYPSKYEGWGLPVAESLGYGRICLASNATSIPEISADLPEFFDPYDVHGLVALVERVLDDSEWVQGREREIRAKFRPTEWRETAAQVMAAIESPADTIKLGVWPRVARDSATAAEHAETIRMSRAA